MLKWHKFQKGKGKELKEKTEEAKEGKTVAQEVEEFKKKVREVGIKEEQVKILGEIDQCITGTNYQVTPIVASISSSYIPRIQLSEVEDLFEVPLDFFLDKKNLKRKNESS